MDYPHADGRTTAQCAVCHRDTHIVIGASRADWYLCPACEGSREAIKAGYFHGLTVRRET